MLVGLELEARRLLLLKFLKWTLVRLDTQVIVSRLWRWFHKNRFWCLTSFRGHSFLALLKHDALSLQVSLLLDLV